MGAHIRAKIVNPIKKAGKRCMTLLAKDLAFKRAKSDAVRDTSAAAVDVFINTTSAFTDPKYTTHPASRFIRSHFLKLILRIPRFEFSLFSRIISTIKDSHLLEMQYCISHLFSRSPTEFLTCDSWFRVPANPTELTSIIRLGYTAHFRASPKVAPSNFLVAEYLAHLLGKIPHALIPESVQKFVMDVHATSKGTHLTNTDLQLIKAVFNLCPTRSSLAVILPMASEESRRRSIEEQWDEVDDFRFTLRGFIAWRQKDGKEKSMKVAFEFWDRWNEIVGCMFLGPSFFF
ncbi:hypothetical protein BJ741DRAFT_682674 [Chytriomyces cf. hyalinus JEL632]|nr:hypothetical protein BJ741DRAFT_682674 [Chytriomyces cf. hyalinus JEL632]